MNLAVTKAKIIRRKGYTDYCILKTEYACQWPETVSKDPLYVTFETCAGDGERYLKEVLGYTEEVEVIRA